VKNFRKLLAVILCVAMLGSTVAFAATSSPAKVDVTKATVKNLTYNGKTQTAKITVDGQVLTQGTDFEITSKTTLKNKKAGTYKVTIQGIGNYSGEKTITYKIAPKKVSVKATAKTLTYNGKNQTVGLTVKTAAGTTLKKGTDYTVTGATHKAAGTYKVTIKGKGNFSFTKTVTYKIAKKTPAVKVAVNTSKKKVSVSGVREKAKVTITTNNKKVKVSGSKVVISKGVKSGTKVTITVKVAATKNFKAVTKKIVYKVK
jgi:lipopolysaccharide export system protein LptA